MRDATGTRFGSYDASEPIGSGGMGEVWRATDTQPMRQWVLSLPFALRFLLARDPAVLTRVLGIVYRAIEGHILRRAGLARATGETGAVTLIQRFGSALNLFEHSYYPRCATD